MIAPNRKISDIEPSAPARGAHPAGGCLEFASCLARKHAISGDILAGAGSADRSAATKRLRDLWELTDLSADIFADEVAGFFGLRRLNLPQLLAASPLAARFSRRFLHETAVF